MAFPFQENRRHGTDRRTERRTDRRGATVNTASLVGPHINRNINIKLLTSHKNFKTILDTS